eukprot:84038-Chlamydomonas_euryale.AAC.5
MPRLPPKRARIHCSGPRVARAAARNEACHARRLLCALPPLTRHCKAAAAGAEAAHRPSSRDSRARTWRMPSVACTEPCPAAARCCAATSAFRASSTTQAVLSTATTRAALSTATEGPSASALSDGATTAAAGWGSPQVP